jgi:hypothetical protein
MNRLLRVLYSLFPNEKPPDTRMKPEEVVAAARAYLEGRGGYCREPIYVSVSPEGKEKRLVWFVRENGYAFDNSAYLNIDDATGEVIKFWVPGADVRDVPRD